PQAVHDVVRRLEGGIQSLIKQEHTQDGEIAPAASESHAPRGAAASAVAPRRLTVVATVSKANETSGRLALAPQPEEEQIAEAVAEEDFEESLAENEPESVADLAMSEAGDIVA